MVYMVGVGGTVSLFKNGGKVLKNAVCERKAVAKGANGVRKVRMGCERVAYLLATIKRQKPYYITCYSSVWMSYTQIGCP